MAARVARCEQACNALYQVVETLRERAPATMRVDLDGLATALDALSQANRREFARIWRRLGHEEAQAAAAEQPQPGGLDPAFQAMLDLQRQR